MRKNTPPPGGDPRTAATRWVTTQHSSSPPVASPQASPSSLAVRQLIERVARDRAIRVERIAALKVAYGALRRADQLAPSDGVLDAAVIALDHLAQTRADLARLQEFAWFSGIGEP